MSVRYKESWPRNVSEAVLLLRVFAMLIRARREARHSNLPDLLARWSPDATAPQADPHRMERVRGFVDGLCARVPSLQDKRCLPRAIVLYHFARRYGYPAVFRCGVQRKDGKSLDGHAWLTLDDRPFLESDATIRPFVVTFSYPEA